MRAVVKGKRPFVMLTGPPGTCKHVQAEKIVENFQYQHFNIAQLVKAESRASTERGQKVALMLNRSIKFPEHLELDLLKEAMARRAAVDNKPPAWLVSGYPRTCEEAYKFEYEVGRIGLLLHLTADAALLVERLARRLSREDPTGERRMSLQLHKYREKARPMLAAYADRLECVDIQRGDEEAWNSVQAAIMRFNASIPTRNKPTSATERMGIAQRQRLSDLLDSRMPKNAGEGADDAEVAEAMLRRVSSGVQWPAARNQYSQLDESRTSEAAEPGMSPTPSAFALQARDTRRVSRPSMVDSKMHLPHAVGMKSKATRAAGKSKASSPSKAAKGHGTGESKGSSPTKSEKGRRTEKSKALLPPESAKGRSADEPKTSPLSPPSESPRRRNVNKSNASSPFEVVKGHTADKSKNLSSFEAGKGYTTDKSKTSSPSDPAKWRNVDEFKDSPPSDSVTPPATTTVLEMSPQSTKSSKRTPSKEVASKRTASKERPLKATQSNAALPRAASSGSVTPSDAAPREMKPPRTRPLKTARSKTKPLKPKTHPNTSVEATPSNITVKATPSKKTVKTTSSKNRAKATRSKNKVKTTASQNTVKTTPSKTAETTSTRKKTKSGNSKTPPRKN